MIPIISDTFYAHLLSRMTIKSATQSCCRFLVRHFTSHILRAFDLKKEKDIKTTIFKPGFVKISFLTLVKKSNALFPPEPSLKYQKISSFYFLKSRYSDETHRKVFGCTLLPLISLKDSKLCTRCFQSAHISYSPSNPYGVSSCHLPLNITLTRWRFGVFGTTAPCLRRAIAHEIQKCVTCIRRTESITKGRLFSYTPHDPVVAGRLGKTDIFWSIISVDLVTEVEVLAHSRARSKSSYKVSILMCMDYVSGSFSAIVIDDFKSHNIMLGLQRLFIRHQTPRIIVSDSGSQIIALTHELEQLNIQLLNLPALHLFPNRVESTIKGAKKLLKTLREDPSSSVYHQPNSLIDLSGKLEVIEVILNNRPIFVSSYGDSANILTPHLLLHPQSTESALMNTMQQFFDPVGIISLVGKDSRSSKNSLRLVLVEYLQNAALRYLQPVEGHL